MADNDSGQNNPVPNNPIQATGINYGNDGGQTWDPTPKVHTEYNDMTQEEVEQRAKTRGDWLGQIDNSHKKEAQKWSNQSGVIKIVPIHAIMDFTVTAVSDIADGVEEPLTQVVPVSNVSVTPHQVSYNFFDTSEGKIGVSNIVEKLMIVECDIYVTDLIYYWWKHPSTGKFGYQNLNLDPLQFRKTKEGVSKSKPKYQQSKVEANCKKNELAQIVDNWKDFESSVEFTKFRDVFLTYYSGWMCQFVSHLFPVFYGVFTELKYDISEGETSAKWHIKFEEGIFWQTSTSGQKTDGSGQGTSGGSGTGSGTASTSDDSDDGNGENT